MKATVVTKPLEKKKDLKEVKNVYKFSLFWDFTNTETKLMYIYRKQNSSDLMFDSKENFFVF